MRAATFLSVGCLIASIQMPSHADPACELPRLEPLGGVGGFTRTYYGGLVSGMDLESGVLVVGAAGEDEVPPHDED